MGRSPCCDKVGLKKGPWTPEEDQKLLAHIQEHGHGSWRNLPSKAGLQRCGKSCRLRWINYLRPDIKRGKFSLQEEQTIIQLHALLGNRWSSIATHLSKGTDNEIKNYWNTHLKKRLIKMGIDPVSHKPKNNSLSSNDDHLNSTSNLSHMAQWESARLEAEARLVKQSKICSVSTLPNKVNSTICSQASAFGTPLKHLDVHKTLIRGITRNKIGDTESSASTLSSTKLESCNETITYEECDEVCEYKDCENGMGGFNDLTMPALGNSWTSEPLQSSNDDDRHVPNGNFLEHFTNLLLCNSNYTKGDNSDIGLVCCDKFSETDENMKDCYEDKSKSYWDNILNITKSSPSNPLKF